MDESKSGNRVWLNEYPNGVPAEINLNEHRSLSALLEESFTRYASRTAFECMGAKLSYAELDQLSAQFAGYLSGELGLKRGDRVAVMMPNTLQYPVAMFGILRAGFVVVNVNPLYTPRELEHQLHDSGARAIVIMENFCTTLQKVIAKLHLDAVITTQIGDLHGFPKASLINFVVKRVKKMVPDWSIPGTLSLKTALVRGARHRVPPVALDHDDLAFLQYTGGTTGLSKGAQLTHGNILGNVLQIQAWIQPAVGDIKEPITIITALPLYHIFALTVNCLTFMAQGGCNLLIPNPRDMKAFVAELRSHRFHCLTGVNTLFNGLLNYPDFAKVDFSHLKLAVGGGAAVLQATAERWLKLTGVAIGEGYGLTEASPVVCFTPLNKLEWNGTIGVPMPSTDVSIRGENNEILGLDQPGELCVKGPQVMTGYWQRPEETAAVFTEDGYLRTGDIATIDPHGYLRIVDRKKDMILVSGFNVFPNEIESTVAMMPGVLECACIGVPDERSGEAVKVFVVRKDPRLSEDDIRKHCREELTGYKVPRYIEFRNELPKSNIGKILRKELRN